MHTRIVRILQYRYLQIVPSEARLVVVAHINFVDVIDTVGTGSEQMHTQVTGQGASAIDTVASYGLTGRILAEIMTKDKVRVFADVLVIGVGVPTVGDGIPADERTVVLDKNMRRQAGDKGDDRPYRGDHLCRINRWDHESIGIFGQTGECGSRLGHTADRHRNNVYLLCICCVGYVAECQVGERLGLVGRGIAEQQN